MFLLVSGFAFYVVVMFFYILLQEFKHTLSKSAERFDLVHAMLLGLIWPLIFVSTMIGVINQKLGLDED